jgi:hypothetical protein
MKVYVLIAESCDGGQVVGVFKSLKSAEKHRETVRDDYDEYYDLNIVESYLQGEQK